MPLLMYAKLAVVVGTATTALPVSWQAGAITGVPSYSPMRVPGGTIGVRMRSGMPNAFASAASHVPVRGL
ncbi:MAG: hypothetical protein HND48_18715 [Chloroflexi bacterium]|nr:hypothetical protein [Chloroflexota bacterium]